MNPLRASVSFVVAALTFGSCACRDGRPVGPHVIVVSLDTTRADHLGCYGGKARTPHLDALARESVVFESAMAAAPTTLASHTSLMTGTYPCTHGIPSNGFVINPSNEMLAEVLARHGFHTAAVLGSFALDRRFQFDQGFAHFDQDFDIEQFSEGKLGRDQDQRRAARVTDAVFGHVDRRRGERLFLFAHYFDAHWPYEPPPPYDALYLAPGAPRRTGGDVARAIVAHNAEASQRLGRTLDQRAIGRHGLTHAQLELTGGAPLGDDAELAALYAGEISYVDAELGRLFAGLRERGILDEAIVVVTADHGETFWEHADVWNHGLWVHDTTVHVPLIVRLPHGEHAGRRVAEPVSGVDLVPTLCELLGIAAPSRVEGVSLVRALRGEPFERGPIYSEATQPRGFAERGWMNAEKAKCVRLGALKYVHAPYLGVQQLYDLAADPGEQNDLAVATQASATALRDALLAWTTRCAPLPTTFDKERQQETMQRLSKLGYTDLDPADERATDGAGGRR